MDKSRLFSQISIYVGGAVFSALFYAFALIQPVALQDPLTNGGWLYLLMLSLTMSVFLPLGTKLQVPSRRLAAVFFGLAATFIFASLMNNATFLEERWLQRYAGMLLLFVLFQVFSTEVEIVKTIKYPISLFLLGIVSESMYQYYFQCYANHPLAASCYSSRFWNINMMAQAFVLSLPFIQLFRKHSKIGMNLFYDALSIALMVAILLSKSRSAYLCLFTFIVLQLLAPQCGSRKRFCIHLVLVISIFFGIQLSRPNKSELDQVGKQTSASYRVEIWRASLELAKENPFGIGVNNFEFGFIPYKRDTKLGAFTAEVDKSPHNEYLRILVEEGWLSLGAIVCLTGVLLIVSAKGLRRKELLFHYRFFLILLPELMFQFPTDLFYPTLLAVLSLVVSLERQTLQTRLFKISPYITSLLCAAACIVFVLRNTPNVPAKVSPRYCRFFPDNWKMCAEFFKVHFESGDPNSALETLHPVVERQPYNFVALNFIFLLGDARRNQDIACNYFALFKERESIPGADISSCRRNLNRQELMRDFEDFRSHL